MVILLPVAYIDFDFAGFSSIFTMLVIVEMGAI